MSSFASKDDFGLPFRESRLERGLCDPGLGSSADIFLPKALLFL